ncbi:hypothetical protein B1M_11805, partial [Burkholderia sp. TJI49]
MRNDSLRRLAQLAASLSCVAALGASPAHAADAGTNAAG